MDFLWSWVQVGRDLPWLAIKVLPGWVVFLSQHPMGTQERVLWSLYHKCRRFIPSNERRCTLTQMYMMTLYKDAGFIRPGISNDTREFLCDCGCAYAKEATQVMKIWSGSSSGKLLCPRPLLFWWKVLPINPGLDLWRVLESWNMGKVKRMLHFPSDCLGWLPLDQPLQLDVYLGKGRWICSAFWLHEVTCEDWRV